jgi:hypothetical protein
MGQLFEILHDLLAAAPPWRLSRTSGPFHVDSQSHWPLSGGAISVPERGLHRRAASPHFGDPTRLRLFSLFGFTQAAEEMGVRLHFCLLVCLLAAGEGRAQSDLRERAVESIVPWLAYNSSCWSTVELQNLGDREVAVEVEAHKTSGALAPLVGHGGIQVGLRAGEHAEYKLQLPEDTASAWVRVREKIPSPQISPVLAVSGATECMAADELHTTVRDVTWPTPNPWFSGDVSDGDDGIIALINTSERQARVWGCYSSGVLYSVPHNNRPAAELTPVCSETIQELVPPFGSRQFPVARGGNSHFSLTTRGDAIVLQLLRPAGTSVKVYRVDSKITFGKEVPGQ